MKLMSITIIYLVYSTLCVYQGWQYFWSPLYVCVRVCECVCARVWPSPKLIFTPTVYRPYHCLCCTLKEFKLTTVLFVSTFLIKVRTVTVTNLINFFLFSPSDKILLSLGEAICKLCSDLIVLIYISPTTLTFFGNNTVCVVQERSKGTSWWGFLRTSPWNVFDWTLANWFDHTLYKLFFKCFGGMHTFLKQLYIHAYIFLEWWEHTSVYVLMCSYFWSRSRMNDIHKHATVTSNVTSINMVR